MKVIYCPNTPDGYDYDVWDDNKLLGRFRTKRGANHFIKVHKGLK